VGADAVIVVGDDQHENIHDDNMPPFVLYIADAVDATLHFNYLGQSSRNQMRRYAVHAELAQVLLEGLMANGFDPAWSKMTREETGLGHAFGRALDFLMPERRFPIVPLMVNTYYPPAPSAKRCLQLGGELRQIVETWPGDARVVVLASGGLTHTVIDEALDAAFLDALAIYDEAYLASMSAAVLIEGTSEIRNWIIAAGAMARGAKIVDYVPCYRTDQGVGCAMGFVSWR
jgi:3-O-methylgallate 3,4-dioxygenase